MLGPIILIRGQVQPWFMIHLWRLDSRNVTYPSPALCLEWLKRPGLWERSGLIFCPWTIASDLLYHDWNLYHRSFLDLDAEGQKCQSRESRTSDHEKKNYLGCQRGVAEKSQPFTWMILSQIIGTLMCMFIFYYQNQLPDLKIGRFR